jgi:hypothetical protein
VYGRGVERNGTDGEHKRKYDYEHETAHVSGKGKKREEMLATQKKKKKEEKKKGKTGKTKTEKKKRGERRAKQNSAHLYPLH